MGAGRGGGGAARRLGLRLPAGRAGRAGRKRAAVDGGGGGRGRRQGVGLARSLRRSSALGLVLVAEPVETLLHLLHLALEVVDVGRAAASVGAAALADRRRRLVGLGRLALAPRER